MSRHIPAELLTSNDATVPLTAVISPDRMASPATARSADRALWAQVASYARCADGGLDPDAWFPVSAEARIARQEAAAAIAVCAACPVRGQCLALSLRHWGIGQHGVWGGLVAAERAQLRARLPSGSSAGGGTAAVPDAGGAVMSRALWQLVKGREA